MTDLAEFLLARIAEDEAEIPDRDRADDYGTGWNSDDATMSVSAPRWLAECETKRDLIEWALGIDYLVEVGDPAAPRDRLGEQVLRIAALPYTTHPEYDEAWRP